MKKKITTVLLAVLCCLALTIPVFTINASATSTLPRLVDDAEILKDSEEEFLLDKMDSLSEEYQCDIVIVTIDSLEGESVVAYADDFFDYNDYGYGTNRDGILLLLSVKDREYAMSTSGYGIDVFTDDVLYNMENKFLPSFSENDFYWGFHYFVESCEFYLERDAIQNDDSYSYDYDDYYTSTTKQIKPFSPVYIPIAIIISAAISITIVNIMKSGLTSVHKQKSATNYVRNGSLKIRNQRENYLYNHVSKIRRDTDNSYSGSRSSSHRSSSSRRSSSRGRSSTHRSSSGRRHGGSSGRF